MVFKGKLKEGLLKFLPNLILLKKSSNIAKKIEIKRYFRYKKETG